MYNGYYHWKPYVPVADRRRKAAREMAKLREKGVEVSPVEIQGRTIARTFWGRAWCENLERYSDFENRLPRGRAYVRNGSVLDLQIGAGEVRALVNGSMIYKVAVKVQAVPKTKWRAISKQTAGAIDSLVELLQGQFSKGVMERLCRRGTGLFPEPSEIKFSCSCPDWAWMCKHVAAVLYGIGARLDERPELLFKLRRVDGKDLVAGAGDGVPLTRRGPAADRVLAAEDLAEVFGLDLASADSATSETVRRSKRSRGGPEGRAGVPRKPSSSKKTAVKRTAATKTPTKKARVKQPQTAPKKKMPKLPRAAATAGGKVAGATKRTRRS